MLCDETPEECDANARKEYEAARSCLRIAKREEYQLRPQDWLIENKRRHARMHLENCLAWKRIAASKRRRLERFQQAAE